MEPETADIKDIINEPVDAVYENKNISIVVPLENPNLKYHNENWMGELLINLKFFGKRKITQIAMPGTHHSGFLKCPSVFAKWSICQQSSITQQLYAGIRGFDFRICDDIGKGELTISHNIPSLCILKEALLHINFFLTSHPKELVVISIHKDWDRKLSPVGIFNAREMIVDIFGAKLISTQLANSSFGELIAKGQVILTSNFDLGPEIDWPVVKSWDRTKSGDEFKLCHNVIMWNEEERDKISFTEAIISLGAGAVIKSIFKGSSNILKISKKANKQLLLTMENHNMIHYLNVFIHDNTNSDLIDKIININRVRDSFLPLKE